MIEFNQLEHLVSITKNKTISKAAEELLISQPGLTRSMQRLEDDLGLSLFDRKKNKIEIRLLLLKTLYILAASLTRDVFKLIMITKPY